MNQLINRVVIVTGASRGVGAATARLLAREGAKVVLADVRDELGEAVAQEIGEAATYIHLDVTSESGWETAVARCIEKFGKVDGLVNNAAIFEWGAMKDYSLAEYHRTIDINQTSVFLGMRAVLGPMADAGGGTIVNISSVNGLVGLSYSIPYAAAKFAVTGMTKSAALEFAPYAIRVNSVHPGLIRTPLTMGSANEAGSMPESVVANGAEPEVIAQAVLFLTSDQSSYCNGMQLVADGGAICGMEGIPPAA